MTLQMYNTNDVRLGRFRCGIIAPPGAGKTLLCTTMSDCMPKGPCEFPLKEHVNLDDTLWINLDGGAMHGGLDSVYAANIGVDYLDLSTTVGAALVDGLLEAVVQAKALVESGKKKTIIVDSISVMDKILVSYAVALQLQQKGGENAKMQMWDRVLNYHTRLAMAFRQLDANVIFTFHEKYLSDFSETKGGEAQEPKRQAEGMTTGTADLDLSGRIRSFFVATSSYIITIKKNLLPGGKVERFLTTEAQDVFTKARTHKLGASEPFDLRMLVDKLYNPNYGEKENVKQ